MSPLLRAAIAAAVLAAASASASRAGDLPAPGAADSAGGAWAVAAPPPGAPAPSLGAPGGPDAPPLHAARLVGGIRVDGRLDDPAWEAAVPATRFLQRDPDEGRPASETTEVRILIGDDALYIGARMDDHDAGRIRAQLVRRDEDLDSDYFTVYLDSYHDRLTSTMFRVSPSGSVEDAAIGADGAKDFTWDAIWTARTTVDSLGWTAEIEIPLSQLRYDARGDGVWGIQLERFIYRKQETDLVAFTPKSEAATVNRYAELTGLAAARPPRDLEFLPYSRVRSEFRRAPAGDPFRDGSDQSGAAGLDLKVGLTSNLTLNGTVNPDFGEVEADPAVVNLTAFETFFSERRPFFVEGADLFRFGQTSSMNNFNTTIPFHARRIGAPPHRDLSGDPGVAYIDAPDLTTIAGAAKLTGKTSGGWSIGLLDAVTPEERARVVDTLGVERAAPVEPRSNYFVARARRDLRQGNTTVGAIVTAVDRDLGDPALRDLLRSRALVGGLDLNHAWAKRAWSFDANVLVSRVDGSPDAIAATQRSSARYFQRPDATHLHYDPARTALSGAAGLLSLNKTAGKHWRGTLTYQDWSPGFEINDLGFQNAADSRGASTLLMYTENTPGPIFRTFTIFTFSNESWNYGGQSTFLGHSLHLEGQLRNYWSGWVRGTWNPGTYDDRLTRGGPIARVPPGGTLQARIDSDSRKSVTVGAQGTVAWDDFGGRLHAVNGTVAIRPTPPLRITLEPGIRRLHDNAQYVTTVTDPTATATYGARYVFATFDQTTLNLDTRIDWTFSPTLSLQFYGQPLVVAADYAQLKGLRAPGTFEFDVYGRDAGTVQRDASGTATIDPDGTGPAAAFTVPDPNFNFRSLIGNAILRWEYRRGSALYVVWQQNRQGTVPIGDFRASRDVGDIFRAPPENVVAVKVTYWLGL
ncbi:MAG: DUF5916 domain-containing protein [Hyphomicrobiales bacterium]